MPKLSTNFTAAEMVRSTSFPSLAVPWDRMEPTPAANIERVVVEFLQPVRDWAGPIRVTSGFRSQAINDALPGSSQRSRHLRGLACDFLPDDVSTEALWRALVNGTVLAASWDRLAVYVSRDPMNLHVDLREWEQGEQRGLLFIASPAWKLVTVDEALEVTE